MKTVNPSNLPLIDYRSLVPFQQNLKDLDTEQYDKLLSSFKKHGYFVPAYVWMNDGTPYIMDAHQRHRVLMHEEIVFENSDYQVPYIEIQASDEKDAKEKLLLIASQYGKVTREGFDEFTYDLDIENLDYHFDALTDFPIPIEDDLDDPEKPEKDKTVKYSIEQLKTLELAYMALESKPSSFVTWLEHEEAN